MGVSDEPEKVVLKDLHIGEFFKLNKEDSTIFISKGCQYDHRLGFSAVFVSDPMGQEMYFSQNTPVCRDPSPMRIGEKVCVRHITIDLTNIDAIVQTVYSGSVDVLPIISTPIRIRNWDYKRYEGV